MDPLSTTALAGLLSQLPWGKIAEKLAADGTKSGLLSLWSRFQPGEREKAARQAIEIFAKEWIREYEATAAFTPTPPDRLEQLNHLLLQAGPEISAHLGPDISHLDLSPIRRQWPAGQPLHDEFDWTHLARNFERALKEFMRTDAHWRAQLQLTLAERQAGPDLGFDLSGYRTYLRKKCGLLHLRAMDTHSDDLPLTLWSVFVPQSARESMPVRELPRALRSRLPDEQHLMNGEPAEDHLNELRERWRTQPIQPVLETIARERLVVILGDPGSGKSSLLKYLTLRWAEGFSGPLPFWVDLKEFARDGRPLLTYLAQASGTYQLDANEVDRRLRLPAQHAAALYLDGLDEVFEPALRYRVREEIASLAARYPAARIIATSRIFGYEPDRLREAGFVHATLEEFDDVQRHLFLEKWHEIAEPDTAKRQKLQARLASALRGSRAIRDLAGNPLLLTMMALLNRNQDLPRNRLDLYREASRVLLHEWDTAKYLPADLFGRQEKEALLRRLAGVMQQGDASGLVGNLIERDRLLEVVRDYLHELGVQDVYLRSLELIRQLEERNFILCYAGADRFSFVHRTFLDYFCASWFAERLQKSMTLDELKQEVYGKHWRDEAWHETLALIAGLLHEKQAEEVIDFLMAIGSLRVSNLSLAAICLKEVRHRHAIVKTDRDLLERLERVVTILDAHDEDELVVAKVNAVDVIARVWPEPQVFERLRQMAVTNFDFNVRTAAVGAIARADRDAPSTRQWVTERALDAQSPFVQTPALRALAAHWKDSETEALLLRTVANQKLHGMPRQSALEAYATGWREAPATLPWLLDRAQQDEDWEVRQAAVWALSKGWNHDPTIPPLLHRMACHDRDSDVRLSAMWGFLGCRVDDAAKLALLADRAQHDEQATVREAALQQVALRAEGHPATRQFLLDRARLDAGVRNAAVTELARLWNADTLAWLLNAARNDSDAGFRSFAVWKLAESWKTEQSVPRLLGEMAASDPSSAARQAALFKLSWDFPDTAGLVDLLKAAVRDESAEVRLAAMQELAKTGDNDETCAILQNCSGDEDPGVRVAALQWLQSLGKSDAEQLRQFARLDPDVGVRTAAGQFAILGWPKAQETFQLLLDLLGQDGAPELKFIAIGELRDSWRREPQTREALVRASRNDEDPAVRQAALDALGCSRANQPEILLLLFDRLHHDPDDRIRRAAAQAIQNFQEGPDLWDALEALRASLPEDWRRAAVVALVDAADAAMERENRDGALE